jgi:ComF family protein
MRAATSSCSHWFFSPVFRLTVAAAVASMCGNASLEAGELFTDIGCIIFYIDGMSIITRAYRNCAPLIDSLRPAAWLRGPSVCQLCHAWCDSVICRSCIAKNLNPQMRCRRCALPCAHEHCDACLIAPPLWQQTVAAVSYVSPWRELIIDYKFHHNAGLNTLLAKLLLINPLAQALIDNADILVPVPLSAQRLRERGFNQAQWLARQLCRERTDDTLLWRLRHTPTQTGLDRNQRMHNLQHAVVVNPATQLTLKHKNVLLVDDVMTTGSTLNVCAQALLAAGADTINAVVLARATMNSNSP